MNIVVPDELLAESGLSEEALSLQLALELYRREKLSMGKAAQLASLGIAPFMQAMGDHGICLNYGVEDLEEDLETLRRLRLLS